MLPTLSRAASLSVPCPRFLALKKPFSLHLYGLLAGLLYLLLTASPARADLMLHPTRIVFDKNQRSAQLELINNGKETATYRIRLVNRRMNEIGEFTPVDTPLPGELFADEFLRFSPRQVVLAPGAGQTVRILLRKPADLPAGEYRSHLQFDRIPETTTGSGIESQETKKESGEVGIQLKALVGVSIPIIVRHGETAANVSLADLQLLKPVEGKPPTLAFTIQRSGNRSVYGDLVTTFTSQDGVVHNIGMASGVAVYSPNTVRHVKLELRMPEGIKLSRGVIRLIYRERLDAGGKMLGETSIELP